MFEFCLQLHKDEATMHIVADSSLLFLHSNAICKSQKWRKLIAMQHASRTSVAANGYDTEGNITTSEGGPQVAASCSRPGL